MPTYQPYEHNFTGEEHKVIQGVYFERSFVLPVAPNLTGMNIKGQVKKSSGDTVAILTFDLADNTIVISGVNPNKTLTLKQNADDMNIPVGSYVIDVIAYNTPEDVIPILKGAFPIVAKVTNI